MPHTQLLPQGCEVEGNEPATANWLVGSSQLMLR